MLKIGIQSFEIWPIWRETLVARLLLADAAQGGALWWDKWRRVSTFPEFFNIIFLLLKLASLVQSLQPMFSSLSLLSVIIFNMGNWAIGHPHPPTNLNRESVRDLRLTEEKRAVATSELGSNNTFEFYKCLQICVHQHKFVKISTHLYKLILWLHYSYQVRGWVWSSWPLFELLVLVIDTNHSVHLKYFWRMDFFFKLSMKGGSQISRINVWVIYHCLLFKCCIVMLSYLVITGHITHIFTWTMITTRKLGQNNKSYLNHDDKEFEDKNKTRHRVKTCLKMWSCEYICNW